MRLSESVWRTYKETPVDAEIPSHRLMLRAGLIHRAAAGIYNLLPLGYRVVRKIESIVRNELDNIGARELLMSVVTPGHLWKRSGRWESMGEMLKFCDKKNSDLCISPTNEEAVVDIFSSVVKSYRDLPVSLYQINTKFRDEIRPRFGLMRGREFIMKDAYTFHMDRACLDRGYRGFYDAYGAILEKIGLDYIVVEADAGVMADGDQQTHEFQVLAHTGEDVVVRSGAYAANIERARTSRVGVGYDRVGGGLERVPTPEAQSVDDVGRLLGLDRSRILKSLLYATDGGATVLAVLLGDDSANETKLRSLLGCRHIRPLPAEEVARLGFAVGSTGPYLVPPGVRVVFDEHVDEEAFYVTGSNRGGEHWRNFQPVRDASGHERADIRMSRQGDVGPDGEGVEFIRGIEVGHIFRLGRKYTEAMGVSVPDASGTALFPLMGCYGMGITRLAAAAVEQHHDEHGIVWPKAIAPLQVYLACLSKRDAVKQGTLALYHSLCAQGFEVLFDDRDVGAGFKFKDADLLGLPLRAVVGDKSWKDRRVEWSERASDRGGTVSFEGFAALVKDFYESS